jgi:hypothetical protein
VILEVAMGTLRGRHDELEIIADVVKSTASGAGTS